MTTIGETARIKAGDLVPLLEEDLFDAHGALDLDGCTVELVLRDRAGAIAIEAPAAITNTDPGRVRYAWQPGDTDQPGRHKRTWRITLPSGATVSVPNERHGGYPVVIYRA